ncbi:MAG: GNAT family N-acetyltransferase [Anaerolineales bacterium]|nr:GNAT family N-acetyltransferase [Anaerolineales bacterium]
MSTLENNHLFRSATMDDLDELLGLFNQYWEVMTGVVKFTTDDFESIFSTPGFDIGNSIQLVTSPQGEIVASVLVIDVGNPPVHPSVYGCVREGYEGQGMGHYLLQWAESRAMQAVERCPEGSRVSMYLQTTPSHQPTIDLFEKSGLGVDTQNLSGATRLYTKAGMHVTHEFAIYEKELRAGEELSKQAGDHPF